MSPVLLESSMYKSKYFNINTVLLNMSKNSCAMFFVLALLYYVSLMDSGVICANVCPGC